MKCPTVNNIDGTVNLAGVDEDEKSELDLKILSVESSSFLTEGFPSFISSWTKQITIFFQPKTVDKKQFAEMCFKRALE